MKLALIVNKFPVYSETFVVNEFLGLFNRGWDVHIVCQNNGAADWDYFPEIQHRPDLRQRVHSQLNSIAAFDQCLAALAPDLIHFEFGSLAIGKMYLKELLSCKITVNFRGYDINYDGLDIPDYYEEIWQRADALLFTGGDLMARAQRRGCPVDKFSVNIPPAIDLDAFDPGSRTHEQAAVGTSDRPLRILSVGRLVWKKGYEFALQAIRLLLDQGVQCDYRIAGAGDYEQVARWTSYQLNVNQHVNFLGAVTQTEVMKQMQWADVLLHPAVSEGFCLAVLEAQAMKLPIVCTDADGLSENIGDGETGFVVPRRDPGALANALARLANDPALRGRLGAAGRQRAITRFESGAQINAVEQFFQKVASEN